MHQVGGIVVTMCTSQSIHLPGILIIKTWGICKSDYWQMFIHHETDSPDSQICS